MYAWYVLHIKPVVSRRHPAHIMAVLIHTINTINRDATSVVVLLLFLSSHQTVFSTQHE